MLCFGMQMEFRLFKIHELPSSRYQQSHQYRQDLRDPETNIGNAYQISGTAYSGLTQPAHPQFDLSIVNRFRGNFPGQSKHSESCS